MQIPSINKSLIPNIPQIGVTQPKTPASGSTTQIAQTFETMLSTLNKSQQNSDNLVQKLAQGDNVDLHSVMIGMEENNVNFNVALGIRDKLVEAYREVMRMQV